MQPPLDSIHWQGLADLSIEAISRGPVRLAAQGPFLLHQDVRYGYDTRWLPGPDGAAARVPVRIDARAQVSWDAAAPAAIVSRVDGYLVLRIEGLGRPRVEHVPPAAPDELTAALLGIHAWHWIASQAGESAEPAIDEFLYMWWERGAAAARTLWLSESGSGQQWAALSRLRTASLDWVSMACLQPGPEAAPAGFGSDWCGQQLRRVCGTEWRPAVEVAARLRARILEQTPVAIAAALETAGLVECRFACSPEGVAELAAALRSATLPVAEAVVPLLLPASFDELEGAAAACTADGRLIVHNAEGTHSPFRAALESGFAAAMNGEYHDVPMEACVAMPAVQAASLLASAGIGVADWSAAGSEPCDASIRILYRVGAGALGAWMQLPPERSASYFPRVAKFSIGLQKALRRWLPACLLADPARLEDLKQGPSYLLYRASDPHKPRTRAAFSNDVLDPQHVRALYRSAQCGLRQLLPPIEMQLRASGLEPIARMYTARRIGKYLEPVRDELPRALASVLAAEGVLIEDLVRIATQLSSPVSMGQRKALIREIPKAVQSALRRTAKGQVLDWLTPVICAEAALAMAEAAGRGGGCEVVVEVEAGSNGRRRIVRRSGVEEGPIQSRRVVADKAHENALEQSNAESQDPGKADDGDDCRRVRAEGECRREVGTGVQPSGRPGEWIHVESDSGAKGDEGTAVPCARPVLRSESSSVEVRQGESGARLPDQLAA